MRSAESTWQFHSLTKRYTLRNSTAWLDELFRDLIKTKYLEKIGKIMNDKKTIHEFDFKLICEYFSSLER